MKLILGNYFNISFHLRDWFVVFAFKPFLAPTAFALKGNSSYVWAKVLYCCFGLGSFQHFTHNFRETAHTIQENEFK